MHPFKAHGVTLLKRQTKGAAPVGVESCVKEGLVDMDGYDSLLSSLKQTART